jgi:hypothetical protein
VWSHEARGELTLPLQFAPRVASPFGVEAVHVFVGDTSPRLPSGCELRRLTRREVARSDPTLVCCGDCLVKVDRVANIQQVFTPPAHRDRGHASAFVTLLTGKLAKQGWQVTYTANEANGASMRVAKKCGFDTIARWAVSSCERL